MEIRLDQNFAVPRGLFRHIRSALKLIDEDDRRGIGYILLLEDVPEISRSRDARLDRLLTNDGWLSGAYKRKSHDEPAHIILIVQSLYAPLPRLLALSSALTVRIAETLAHEVAHHLVAEGRARVETVGSESEEKFARGYEDALMSRLNNNVGTMLLKTASHVQYCKGLRALNRKRYIDAASHFKRACQIWEKHPSAGYWFHEAKRMTHDLHET